ncbi:nucleotide sugar dehydrogenase [Effusibacillus pohliae]|uniref:nucleotide sugar dehydrogenase n=1 Tax=Effusibacillus pohliae TaxID=232270 RepID=UPI0003611345|nr:nucleotide sugar dehydrogenase [Effusibacillus pohliae]
MREIVLYKLAIIGLGYVGLPLARLFLKKGHTVYGIDVDANKIRKLMKRQSYLSDFTNGDIRSLFATGRFFVGDSYDVVAEVDAVILCVPTPLDEQAQPDLQYVRKAMESALPYLRNGQLVVLESSTYPGTTEEELRPLLEASGLQAGKDVALAYSPERIDPGQDQIALHKIPKVLGGVTPRCTQFAKRVYETVFDQVVVVSSPRVAEMTKLLENCQRFVNISFMNELAMLCDRMQIDLWEVIAAASTKPYGFTPYYPGPGIGGHCIPVDPLYLSWKAREYQFDLQFIELAHKINQQMPDFVVWKLQQHLSAKKPLAGSRVFVIGVTYKKDVNDTRESTAFKIIERLLALGILVNFYDPYIKEIEVAGMRLKRLALTRRYVEQHDCTLILTDHTGIPYESIVAYAPLVIDTRNATRSVQHRRNVILL